MKKNFLYRAWLVNILIFLLVFVLSCKPERNNPWDDNMILNPDEWMPFDPEIIIHSSNSLTINWQYNIKNIEGFTIDRKEGQGTWQLNYATLPASQKSYTDNAVCLPENYAYRVYAFAGINKSSPVEIEININIPILTTSVISEITSTTAISGGNISSDGGFAITARGVVWSTTENPTLENYIGKTSDGTGIGYFTSKLTNLNPETLYYLRAYAINSMGTVYGNQVSFSTLAQISDADGNTYNAVWIGNQLWMAENLKTTKYNDGTNIPHVTGNNEWANLTSGAYCWYDNDPDNGNTYRALYNWYAVGTGKLCPTGWHVPSDAEWTDLTDYLGGESVAGGKLKEAGTAHWYSPNTGATNETGFTALPGGSRYYSSGVFNYIGTRGHWWSSTEFDGELAWYRSMYYGNRSLAHSAGNKNFGFSIRCVRD